MIHSSVDSFSGSFEIFLSFFYAAALDVVITHQMLKSPHSLLEIIVLLSLIIFLASDWSSKVRVRHLISEGEQFSRCLLVIKTGLELVGLFLLMLTLVYLFEYSRNPLLMQNPLTSFVTPVTTFGFFALISGLWDLLLIKTIDLTWLQLVKFFFRGTLDQEETTLAYVQVFREIRDGAINKSSMKLQQIAPMFNNARKEPARIKGTVKILLSQLKYKLVRILTRFKLALIQGALATWSHFVGAHIGFLNFIVGSIILCSDIFFRGKNQSILENAAGLNYSWLPPILLIAIVIIPSVFFCYKFRKVAVLSFLFFLLATYFSLKPTILLPWLMSQQLLVTMFFHLFAKPKKTVAKPITPGSSR